MIKPLDIANADTQVSKSEIPTTKVAGRNIREFVVANRIAKEADASAKEAKGQVVPLGLSDIFKRNCTKQVGEPLKSVILTDDTGASVRVTLSDRYSAADPAVVEAAFAAVRTVGGKKVDAGDFVQYVLAATFNADVFIGPDGTFSKERYTAFKTAIDQVATTLGVASPLATKTIVQPKDNFHTARWALFDVANQDIIQKALPATVSVYSKEEGTEPTESLPTVYLKDGASDSTQTSVTSAASGTAPATLNGPVASSSVKGAKAKTVEALNNEWSTQSKVKADL